MPIDIIKLSDVVTVIQQQQDPRDLGLGYVHRLNLTNEDIGILILWLHENKNDVFWNVLCQPCADINWDGG